MKDLLELHLAKCKIKWLFLGLLVTCIGSCNIHQSDEQALNLAHCQMHCRENLELCHATCSNHCAHCENSAAASAACGYDQYLQEIEVQGGIIARELNSYRDPLQCRKITCNCSADFNLCSQGCTGIIQKQLRAKPYCT
ncbi:MAG: acyltransferase [Legionella sp.]|nr:acyltransferase [Legionella sp.]